MECSFTGSDSHVMCGHAIKVEKNRQRALLKFSGIPFTHVRNAFLTKDNETFALFFTSPWKKA